jgi:rod shape-determining protein MreD
MKFLLYIVLALLVVPFQTTLLHYLSILGVRPDLGLVAACLVGFLGGELDGLILGLLLGCFQDMLSAGDLWINVVTKGGAGFLAGLAGRHMAHITPAVLVAGLVIISCLSSGVFLYAMNPAGLDQIWVGIHSTVLVQAAFDAAIGAGLYVIFRRRWSDDRMVTEGTL